MLLGTESTVWVKKKKSSVLFFSLHWKPKITRKCLCAILSPFLSISSLCIESISETRVCDLDEAAVFEVSVQRPGESSAAAVSVSVCGSRRGLNQHRFIWGQTEFPSFGGVCVTVFVLFLCLSVHVQKAGLCSSSCGRLRAASLCLQQPEQICFGLVRVNRKGKPL